MTVVLVLTISADVASMKFAGYLICLTGICRVSDLPHWYLQGIWGGLMALTSLLLLLPPSHFTHTWHMASEQFNSVNDDSPVWEAYRVQALL